jgi:hypothetical protein
MATCALVRGRVLSSFSFLVSPHPGKRALAWWTKEYAFGSAACSRQQPVKQHTQRADVAAGIGAQGAHLRLLRAHVFQRADHGAPRERSV